MCSNARFRRAASANWCFRPPTEHPLRLRRAAAKAFEENLFAGVVFRGRQFAGSRAFVFDAPALPLPEGVVRPVPAVLLENFDAVAQVFLRARGSTVPGPRTGNPNITQGFSR